MDNYSAVENQILIINRYKIIFPIYKTPHNFSSVEACNIKENLQCDIEKKNNKIPKKKVS